MEHSRKRINPFLDKFACLEPIFSEISDRDRFRVTLDFFFLDGVDKFLVFLQSTFGETQINDVPSKICPL
jgi:hypothetical protein